jgi:hypothetical protein
VSKGSDLFFVIHALCSLPTSTPGFVAARVGSRPYLALPLDEITTLFFATTFTSTSWPGWRPV